MESHSKGASRQLPKPAAWAPAGGGVKGWGVGETQQQLSSPPGWEKPSCHQERHHPKHTPPAIQRHPP